MPHDRDVLAEPPPEYKELRPWGEFRRLVHNEPCTVKLISVKTGERLSLQSHEKRSELWLFLDDGGVAEVDEKTVFPASGETVFIPCGARHRLGVTEASTSSVVRVVEMGFGTFDEDDIVRYDDNYGRA